MKIQYRDPHNMRAATRELLDRIVAVVDDYGRQGHRLTLRQLYYQFVAAAIIPNEQSQYSKLSNMLVNARMYGMIDWNSIEDRVRVPAAPAAVGLGGRHYWTHAPTSLGVTATRIRTTMLRCGLKRMHCPACCCRSLKNTMCI